VGSGRPALALLVLPALFGGAAPARADAPGLRLTTLLESDTAWRLRQPRSAQKSQNRLELDLEAGLAPGLEFRAIGRVIYDPVALLVGPHPDFDQKPIDRWQVDGSRQLEAELRELYLDWQARLGAARLDLRLGKQQVVWGQAFGLRVLDQVNAMDFREFILDEFSDARVPVFGGRLDVTLPRGALQVLLFPDYERDRLADPESEFALDVDLPGFLPPLVPAGAADPGFLVDLLGPDTPQDWRWSTLAFGLRASTTWRGLDLALYYWDRYDTRPAFSREVAQVSLPGVPQPLFVNQLQAQHFRVRGPGASVSTAWRDFTFSVEGALNFGTGLVTSDPGEADGLVRRPELQYALGADWIGREPLFANLQLIQFVVLDHDRSIEVDEFRTFLSLLLRLELRRETVLPQLFVLYGTGEDDTLIRPSVELRLTDRLSLTLGADVFTGPRDGVLGEFARRRECLPVPGDLPVPDSGGCAFDPPPGRTSRVFLRLRYLFSLGS
jgi:hypothetical protein